MQSQFEASMTRQIAFSMARSKYLCQIEDTCTYWAVGYLLYAHNTFSIKLFKLTQGQILFSLFTLLSYADLLNANSKMLD